MGNHLERKFIYKDKKIRSQRFEIDQLKDDIRKIIEEFRHLYGLLQKLTDKLKNELNNLAELEYENSLP